MNWRVVGVIENHDGTCDVRTLRPVWTGARWRWSEPEYEGMAEPDDVACDWAHKLAADFGYEYISADAAKRRNVYLNGELNEADSFRATVAEAAAKQGCAA